MKQTSQQLLQLEKEQENLGIDHFERKWILHAVFSAINSKNDLIWEMLFTIVVMHKT